MYTSQNGHERDFSLANCSKSSALNKCMGNVILLCKSSYVSNSECIIHYQICTDKSGENSPFYDDVKIVLSSITINSFWQIKVMICFIIDEHLNRAVMFNFVSINNSCIAIWRQINKTILINKKYWFVNHVSESNAYCKTRIKTSTLC